MTGAASVRYPDGKGQRLRFFDGVFLRSDTNFGNSFGTALAIAGAATGSIALTQPATVAIELPGGVAQDIPGKPEDFVDLLVEALRSAGAW